MNDEEEYILTMPKVRTSDSHYIAWDRENVIRQILTDTQLCEKFYEYPPASRELAEDVASSVEEAIEGLDLKYLKSSMVREFVCLEFLKRGMIEYHNACMRVGTSLHDAHAIDTGDGYGARDNANLQANPETSHKHKADKMSKEQYLLMMPPKVADAHLKSYIHIHDLEYFGSRSFCMDASTIVPVFNGKQIKTLTPAEMMLDPNAPVSVPKENICAFTPHGTRPITKITRRNIDNDTMYKIRATNGKSVKVTENHRIPVIRNDTYLVIPASEVREGDELMTVNLQMNDCVASINLIDALIETVPERMLKNICVRNAREIIDTIGLKYIDISRKVGFEKHMKGWYTKGSIPIREFKQICETFGITDYKTCEVGCTGSPHTFPAILPLTNYLFEIMGAFVADGNYNVDEVKGHYNLVITDEPYHLSRYTMMLNEMGMHVTQCAPDTVTTSMIGNIVVSGKRTPQIYFGSKILYLLFHYIWGIGRGAHEKRLPNIIYNVGSPLLNAFMRGLFTGDGTVNYNQRTSNCAIMYSTVSEKLNQEIMLLLQMNGIVAGVYEVANETGTTCYRVRISGRDNIERFTHICTFMDERQDIVQEFLRNVNGITRINRNKNIVGSVESVTPSDEWVYDIFLDGDGSDESHTFIAGDGFLIHNCMDSDLRYLYYYGFMPDGKGSSASVSAPAKNPEVAVLHAVKYLAASQTNFAGGQGYYNFLTFIAPYFEGLEYSRIKQFMQMMVYELTQMMVARGGQVVFSSLQLSPGVPTLWRDVPVVYKGRIWNGEHDVPKRTYGEFEREVRLAFKALMDVMIDGDYWGKPFNFPKPEISIEPDFVTISNEITAWDMEHPDIPTYKELYLMAFDLAAKFGTPYFDNQIPAYRGAGKGISCYQCLPEDTIVYIMRDNKPRDVPIKDLLTSDLILTPTRGYQPFEGILSKPYEGEMIEFVMRNRQSYSCTPDHSVVVKTIDMPHFVTMPANEVSLDDEMVVLVNGVATSVQIECIHTIPNFRGVVYDPINVPGHQFVIEDGIVTGNCCAYNFSSNIDEDDEFYDKVYFRNGAHFSMGSLQVVTLNCPRAAYDSGSDVEKLVRNIKNYMNVARDVFVIKKRWIDEIIRCNKLPFVVQRPRDPITGEPGAMAVDMDGLVCTIGVLGFNEMVQHVTGYQLHESKVAHKTALYILAELNKHARKLSEESGLKIVVARTPAETTCQRFAVSDLLNPDYTEHARNVVKGDLDAFDRLKKTTRDLPVYYTNGTHVAVDAPISLPERMKIENPFFVMVQGGNIFHVWLGEAHPEPRGLYEFCMNIATQTQIGYFALTRDMTIPVNRYTWYTEEFDTTG